MASEPSRSVDELTTAIRSLIDRALESQTREQIAARGRELASAIVENAGNAAGKASEMAEEAWRESAPQRRDAAKTARRMSRDAARWSRRTWIKQLRPALRDAWGRRAAAIGAAGVVVPASRELVDQARVKLGLRQQEAHRWRIFFLGMLLGAIGGAIVALLTAPRPGREVRDELASRARDAATNASEWVPIFQREVTEATTPLPGSQAIGGGAEIAPPTPERVARRRQTGEATGDIPASKGNGAENLSTSSMPDIEAPESDTI